MLLFPVQLAAEASMKMGTKQQRRAHFHEQPRDPAGLSDAGRPSLLLSWPRKKEEK